VLSLGVLQNLGRTRELLYQLTSPLLQRIELQQYIQEPSIPALQYTKYKVLTIVLEFTFDGECMHDFNIFCSNIRNEKNYVTFLMF